MALLKSGTRVYGFATIDTTLSVDGNDVATSNTTGALKVSGGIGAKGNIFSSGNITAQNADLGNLVVANYITGTLTTSSQPNITSIGNLSSLTVTGNVTSGNLNTVDATITGNLIVSGQAIYANVTTLNIKDSIIEQGGNVDGVPLNANAGKDLGSLLHYYTSAPIAAFMGWKVANNEFVVASNVSISNGVVTVNELGNLRAGNFVGNVTGSASTVTTNAQPNITSLGTLGNLNVTNTVDAANLIGTVKTSAQPNITSLGNLTSLKVDGITDLGTVGNVKIYGGTNGQLLKTDGTGNLVWVSVSTGGGNANVGGSNTEVFFNNGNSTTLGTSANFTFNNSTNTLSVTNVTATNLNVTGNVTSNLLPNANVTYDLGSTDYRWRDLYLSGNSIYLGNAQLQANNSGLKVANGNIEATFFKGDGSMLSNLPSVASSAFITSNIVNLTSGSDLGFDVVYGNAQYPGGVFTLYQLGPVSFTASTTWASGGTSKNQYSNFLETIVNNQNIRLTLNLTNANFSVQSTDTITIGGSVITGANITGLGITGTGGTFTISSSLVNANVQTNSSSTVSANLTTSRGVKTVSSTTLTTVAPVAYNVNSISGSFPSSTVPYWSLNQSFNWSMSVTGTTQSGNLTFTSVQGYIPQSLNTVGATSGTSSSVDSTAVYTITTEDYTGAGLNGYGTRTIPAPVSGTVNAATKYYPLFWKITNNGELPTFTTSDSRNSNNFTVGQSANTSSTSTDYLWMAIPNTGNVSQLQSRTFKHVFGGFDIVDVPSVTGTQIISANGQSYRYSIYGFSSFSAVSSIIVTS
jgi:hypothetical protein